MKTIARSYMFFIKQKPNSLRHLPDTLIQEFLELISGEITMIPIFERLFLKKLLNSNTTKFDGCEFSWGMKFHTWDDIFSHLLKNCPKVYKIVQNDEWHYDIYSPDWPMEDLLRWTKLEHASLSSYVCSDEHLELIQQHLPRLKHLEIGMGKNTEKAVNAFSKMQNLKHLGITAGCRSAEIDFPLLAHCVGRTPNLQSFHLHEAHLSYTGQFDFVLMFWKMYWYKKITITQMTVNLPIKINWPSNVSVENLHVDIDQSSAVYIKRLSSVPCSPAGLVVTADPVYIYLLVEILGQNTKSIEINTPRLESEKVPLDLSVVLKHCPKLENLRCFSDGFSLPHNIRKSPELFRNLKNFEFITSTNTWNQVLQDDSKANEFYKQFLLGSERHDCKNFEVSNLGQILAISEALAVRPECLKLLENVSVLLYNYSMLEAALKMVQCLIFCSPNLKKVYICFLLKTTSFIQRAIDKDHSWFKELVTKVGVVCKLVPDRSFPDLAFLERNGNFGDLINDDVYCSGEEIDEDVVME
ncbi:uncharacterized protein LOC132200265 isoform X2 [Neocloeon triangulifer]|nr:uncharacterized protein LOC132200265 isoform X2 [Neocloeon triangulifer]